MPPPVEISDEESAGGSIPFDSDKKNATNEVMGRTDDDNSVDESDEEGEGVFVVEKIMDHEFGKDGSLLLKVKWKGYENVEDQTLEPEENLLEGAKDAVTEYYEKLGGRPEKSAKKRKALADTTSTSAQKKPKKSQGSENGTPDSEDASLNWLPKARNWDKEIQSIDTISRDEQTGNLFVYLTWNNKRKSKVSIQQCYEKCAMKMLKFYEQHLVFKEAT